MAVTDSFSVASKKSLRRARMNKARWILIFLLIGEALSDEDIIEYLVSRCVPLQGLIKAYSTILEWRDRLDQECDLHDVQEVNKERVRIIKSSNPRFVLRNYIAQRAVEAAENGDFSLVQTFLKRLKRPYRDDVEFDEATLYVAASTNSTLSCNHEKTRQYAALN